MSAHAARERLSEVRQQPVDLGEGLGVAGVVVEHEAARGDVEGRGIHGVHRRRWAAAGSRASGESAGGGGPARGAQSPRLGGERSGRRSPRERVAPGQSSRTWGPGAPPACLGSADKKGGRRAAGGGGGGALGSERLALL